MRRLLVAAAALAAAVAGSVVLPGPAEGASVVKPYVTSVASDYRIRVLLSVGEQVPLTTDPTKKYRMIGIPDGLGAYDNGDGTFTLLMNHEAPSTAISQPVVGGPDNYGAIVSKFIVDRTGKVLSGARAYDQVFVENTPIGPAAQPANALGRLCSGFLADSRVGFDEPIWLAGEEVLAPAAGPAPTFDGIGSLGFAFFDGEAHALPKLGHYPKENVVVVPGTGSKTVLLIPEDGPQTADSQLYMYVGTKDTSPGASVLRRNGLDNGKLYVLTSTPATSEAAFHTGTLSGAWTEVPNAESMSEAALETAVDTLGAFGFVRVEDLATSATAPGEAFFVSTGNSLDGSNKSGRLYTLKMDPTDPVTQPVNLHVVVNADQVVAADGDTALSPDNVAVNDGFLMVQEDGHEASRGLIASKGRDGSIWRFPLTGPTWEDRVNVAAAKRVAELDPPGREGTAVGAGIWETSGIIDANPVLGIPNSWLSAVQAHIPTPAPASKTLEDGQLVLLTPNTPDDLGYWLTAADGGIFTYGKAAFHGSAGNLKLVSPIVGMASTPTGKGYWLVAADGGIFTFGDAPYYGSTGNLKLAKPIVGMAATPTGKGYWLVAADGGVFAFGDASFHGSTGAVKLNQPVVGMAAAPSGQGYWLVAADGGVFTFGAADYKGSTGAIKLNKPIVGAAATPFGMGYWLVASDGGVFAFGDAAFHGSTGAIKLNQPIVGMAATPTGRGYWIVASDGGVFTFGEAAFRGSAGATPLVRPVVGMSAYQGGL